jgi:hypothetical protein
VSTLPSTARPVTIADVAKLVRSKNAGPFQLTVDALFATRADYELVRGSGALTREAVALAYRIPVDQVLAIHYWDAALAIKVTLRRATSAGGPGDNDCYGAQQHAPLLSFLVPTRG